MVLYQIYQNVFNRTLLNKIRKYYGIITNQGKISFEYKRYFKISYLYPNIYDFGCVISSNVCMHAIEICNTTFASALVRLAQLFKYAFINNKTLPMKENTP